MFRTRSLALLAAATLLGAASAFAQDNPAGVSLSRSVSGTVAAGQTVSVTVTINRDASNSDEILALGLYETIPAGTAYQSVTSANGPGVKPTAPGETGTLEFAWIDVPSFPYSFTYTVALDSNFVSPSNITGYVEYRLSGNPLFSSNVSTTLEATPVDPGDDEPEWKQGLLAGCGVADGGASNGLTDALVIGLVALALGIAAIAQPRMQAQKQRSSARR